MTRLGLSLALVLLAFGIFSCTERQDPDALARIAGQTITKVDFEVYLKLKRIPAEPPAAREEARKAFLERLALASAVAQERVLDTAMLEAELRDLRTDLLIKRYFDIWLGEKVSEDVVKQHYEANRDGYKQRRVNVAHILFRIAPSMTEAQKSHKLAIAKATYEKLRGGAVFSALARQMSEDPVSAKKGGALGWIREGMGDRRFFQAAFALKKGEVSQPVEGQLGYHIILAIEDPMQEALPYEQAKFAIRNKLRYEARQAEIKRLLSKVEIKQLQ